MLWLLLTNTFTVICKTCRLFQGLLGMELLSPLVGAFIQDVCPQAPVKMIIHDGVGLWECQKVRDKHHLYMRNNITHT